MPQYITASELVPGMTLASNVMNKYSVILQKGSCMTQEGIDALIKHYPDIKVHVCDPNLDEFADFEDDTHSQAVANNVCNNISNLASKVTFALRDKTLLDANSIRGIKSTVDDMADYMAENKVTKAIINNVSSTDDYFQEHSSNVFYLSMMLGSILQGYIKSERKRLSAAKTIQEDLDLRPLAMAAMLCDIGMIPLKQIRTSKEPLSIEEVKLIRMHPQASVDMLPEDVDQMTKIAILQHHETMTGNGYPDQLKADQINVFARIIRVADAYSSATSESIYADAKSPVRVLYEMLTEPNRNTYDLVVLKIFSGIMQPLPIGGVVKLEDGRTAVVVRHQKGKPFDPIIIPSLDKDGEVIKQDNLQTPFAVSQDPDVKLAFYEDEDIRYLNDAVIDFSFNESDSLVALAQTQVLPEEPEEDLPSFMPTRQPKLTSTTILNLLYP